VIQQRGSRWRVVVYGGRDPFTRRPIQYSDTVDTEAEARSLERRLQLRAEAEAEADHAGRIPLGVLVEEWWESKPRLAATTEADYRARLGRHILPALGDRRVEEIRPRLVAQFLRRLQDDGMSPASARKVRTILSSVLSYAVAMEYVDSNPVMKIPPPELPDSGREAPTVEEAARLLLAAEEWDPTFLTYLWVAAEEGGRRGETLALRWEGIDVERSCVTIDSVVSIGTDGVKVRPRTKTKKPRTIAVSRFTLDRLAGHRAEVEAMLSTLAGEPRTVDPKALVFSGGNGSRRHPLDGRPWNPNSTTRKFKQLKERAGVRPDIDLHGLRHTMVTELLTAGVDPRTVMGRVDRSTPDPSSTSARTASRPDTTRRIDDPMGGTAPCQSGEIAQDGEVVEGERAPCVERVTCCDLLRGRFHALSSEGHRASGRRPCARGVSRPGERSGPKAGSRQKCRQVTRSHEDAALLGISTLGSHVAVSGQSLMAASGQILLSAHS
jgi:integrase